MVTTTTKSATPNTTNNGANAPAKKRECAPAPIRRPAHPRAAREILVLGRPEEAHAVQQVHADRDRAAQGGAARPRQQGAVRAPSRVRVCAGAHHAPADRFKMVIDNWNKQKEKA